MLLGIFGAMLDVRSTRKALGLTQTELADKLGLNQSTISRLEKGVLPVDERTCLALEAIAARVASAASNEAAAA